MQPVTKILLSADVIYTLQMSGQHLRKVSFIFVLIKDSFRAAMILLLKFSKCVFLLTNAFPCCMYESAPLVEP